ncbi:hypothetical protein OPV22_004726 [Ensete ventricosum]|uniref:Uncharacterized protein n=1 Tax=Ensete ventricosum TaxID=4639 RepID=A0AAV8RMJ8_ENSVE|nr:hypothetical protein OPV22_004726 [Ensete ventricosum]
MRWRTNRHYAIPWLGPAARTAEIDHGGAVPFLLSFDGDDIITSACKLLLLVLLNPPSPPPSPPSSTREGIWVSFEAAEVIAKGSKRRYRARVP